MQLEVLVSCMNQKNESLVKQSCIISNVLLVNQCDQECRYEFWDNNRKIRRIDTLERGLSNSRNMAIRYAEGDVCLLCDDDERFFPSCESDILNTFCKFPDADVIAFKIKNHPCKLKARIQKLKWFQCLRISSCQIAFRRTKIQESPVRFDPFMGAGSGNGAGEEVKFLLDCVRHGMNIYFVPIEIGELKESQSTWFQGFDENYFYKRGCSTRYMLGAPLAIVYAIYYAVFKNNLYRHDLPIWRAAFEMFRGIYHNEIYYQKFREKEDQ